MAKKRRTSIDSLIVKESSSFKDTIINDVANPVDLTDVVNLQTLNAAVISGGWDEATFDTSTGDLKFLIASILDFTVSLNGRYQTAAQVQALIDNSVQTVYSITLPDAADVSARIALAVEGTDYPTGWVLTADGLNIQITHGLDRRLGNATVWANTSGTIDQLLPGTAAYNGLFSLDTNNVKLNSLATIRFEIKIYLIFE